jgi:hypothetical protein
MLEGNFGKKCIIVHFLGMEKEGKAGERSLDVETLSSDGVGAEKT